MDQPETTGLVKINQLLVAQGSMQEQLAAAILQQQPCGCCQELPADAAALPSRQHSKAGEPGCVLILPDQADSAD
jgi:hypothetical protein